MTNRRNFILAVAISMFAFTSATGQRGRAPGHGVRHGQGNQYRRGGDERHAKDRELFHDLLASHKKIKRSVKRLPDGVSTLTESDDPDVAKKIKEHVRWMEHRITKSQPIRMRDPLFAEIFRHAEEIRMKREETDRGVRVVETSQNPYVVKLIQAHADAVTSFVQKGFAEAMKNHEVPNKSPSGKSNADNRKARNHQPLK